ncbi:MAG: hypothetical protein GX111_09465, partial [Clostridiales bacterium]|nr:hypothetical protein [Clostridiales bacterium]
MKKTLLTITLALVIVFSALSIPAMALTDMEGYPIPDLEKPVSLTVRRGQNHEEELLLRLTQPESIVNLYEPYYIAIELDIKINNGAWFFDRTPGHFREPDIADYYEEKYPDISIGSIVLYPGSIIHDEHNSFDSWLYPEFIGLDGWDLTNNTYYFRYRYICEYDAYDGATGAYGYKDVVSLWSDIAAIGKGADSQIPTSLEAPQNLAGQIKKDMNQKPYFTFTHTIPESVIKANQDTEIVGVLDWRPEGGVWASETADGMAYQPGNVLLSSTEFTPPSFDADEIEKQNWQFRM